MSERMTDAEFEGRVIGAMSLVERDLLLLPEARRARAEEERQAEVIRELADALEATWRSAHDLTGVNTDAIRAALRKAGRLP